MSDEKRQYDINLAIVCTENVRDTILETLTRYLASRNVAYSYGFDPEGVAAP